MRRYGYIFIQQLKNGGYFSYKRDVAKQFFRLIARVMDEGMKMYGLFFIITIDMRDVCSKSNVFFIIKGLLFFINVQIKLFINDDDMFDYFFFMGRRFVYCIRCYLNREVFKVELWIIRKQRSDYYRLLLWIIN